MSEDATKVFEEALADLAKIGGFSNMASIELRGRSTDRQGELASMVHGKMCAHARSIGAVAQSSMFDHSAIVGLSRMIVEGLTMYAYRRHGNCHCDGLPAARERPSGRGDGLAEPRRLRRVCGRLHRR